VKEPSLAVLLVIETQLIQAELVIQIDTVEPLAPVQVIVNDDPAETTVDEVGEVTVSPDTAISAIAPKVSSILIIIKSNEIRNDQILQNVSVKKPCVNKNGQIN
jgi:hypothetical protein